MRCKACNEVLEDYEIIWDEEKKTHEDLCTTCRGMVYEELESIHITKEVENEVEE